MLPCPVCSRRVSSSRINPWSIPPYIFPRIFELLMAFDALRLRNIIQLFGILSEWIPAINTSPQLHCRLTNSWPPFYSIPWGSHSLCGTSNPPNTDCASIIRWLWCVNKLHRTSDVYLSKSSLIARCCLELWWTGNVVDPNKSFPRCYSLYHRCIVVLYVILDQTAIQWIWVGHSLRSILKTLFTLNATSTLAGLSSMSLELIPRWKVSEYLVSGHQGAVG